jgi:RNA polymerase sigma-70 factor (ECF subfamily)
VGGERKGGSVNRETFANEAMAHLDHLYRLAFHLAKDEDQAQDLVQETFARALAAYDQFSIGSNMKAWLTKILYNFFFDRYHDRKRWISTDSPADQELPYSERLVTDNPGPEDHVLLKELDDQLTAILRTIPEEFRGPILLVDLGDFSYAEAAEILSCPVGTIRSRLSRGRRLVHYKLAAYMGADQKKSKQR